MSSPVQFFISENDETFYVKSEKDVFVHVYDENKCVGFQIDNVVRISEFKKKLQDYFSDFKNLKTKIIGPYHLNRQVQQKLNEFDVDIEKSIYCTSFELYYNPSQLSIKLKKKDYDKINVLVVDDSKSIRDIIIKSLASDSKINVVGESENGQDLVEKIKRLDVHVITLDMQMPVVNGPMALRQFFPVYPVPAVIVSAVSLDDKSLAMEAMNAGAFDYLQKPLFDKLDQFCLDLVEKVNTAFRSKFNFKYASKKTLFNIKIQSTNIDQDKIIVVGSSTGGTEALRDILTHLPKNIPPILIVQHIPAGFSKAFADRMNTLCPFEVKEAENHDEIVPGLVLIAPGGRQMGIRCSDNKYYIKISDDEPVNRHKPSVDFLFSSLVENCKRKIVAVILTGMGNDGAQGMKQLKMIGAATIAQNEESCIVYGMPQAAVKLGCVDYVIHLKAIPSKILELISTGQRGSYSSKKVS